MSRTHKTRKIMYGNFVFFVSTECLRQASGPAVKSAVRTIRMMMMMMVEEAFEENYVGIWNLRSLDKN